MMFRLVPLSALGDFVNSSYFTPDYAGGFVEYTGSNGYTVTGSPSSFPTAGTDEPWTIEDVMGPGT